MQSVDDSILRNNYSSEVSGSQKSQSFFGKKANIVLRVSAIAIAVIGIITVPFTPIIIPACAIVSISLCAMSYFLQIKCITSIALTYIYFLAMRDAQAPLPFLVLEKSFAKSFTTVQMKLTYFMLVITGLTLGRRVLQIH